MPEEKDPVAIFTAADGNKVVKDFIKDYEVSLHPKLVHRAQLAIDDKARPLLELFAVDPGDVKVTWPERFHANVGGKQEMIHVKLIEAPVPRGCGVHSGEFAGHNSAVGGTAGWNVFLETKLLCLSARHAICKRVDGTQIGDPVFLGRGLLAANAKVYCHQPITPWVEGDPVTYNKWDLAAAEYKTYADAKSAMRACQLGHNPPQYGYPMKLTAASSVGPSPSIRYHKVGDGLNTCDKGLLQRSVGVTTYLEFSNGQAAFFEEQLGFQYMSKTRDSGAIAVRDTDNTVTGLIIASSSHGIAETIACPIYDMKWTLSPDSPRPAPGGGMLPKFTPSPNLPRCFG